ncbi:uncharacterized protein K02A2.6-like [Leguminivora glycinivorella]|uniref:uncharacterized protein K02A2.6-like n=1 Tax=Leguminivora glycinivorella TaxID=1035111 RepID=UPI00200C90E6|nr:uncharacterized protein K02A2.6-like [Leguminivora glycinivorella]
MTTPTNDAVSGIKPPANLQINSEISTNWKKWSQQFEWFATAIQLDKKPAEVQAATFMAVIGPDAIEIYDGFNLNETDKVNIKIIKQKFTEYFAPKTNISFERYIFYKIEQNEDEPFNDFMTRIKTQAIKCDFGSLLDEMLKDKIVFGIKSTQIREKLLTEDELTLTKAINICKTSEQASKQLDEFEGKNKTEKVFTVKSKNSKEAQNEKFDCRRCGTNHGRKECPAFNKPCTKCNRNGHFAHMCRTKKSLNTKKKNKVHALEESSDSEEEFYIGSISADGEKSWKEELEVDGVKFKVKLDTGAECNVLPKYILDQTKATLKQSRTRNLTCYSENEITVLGEVELMCKLRDEWVKILFKVIEERHQPILGRKSCKQLGLVARIKSLKTREDIFEGLGCYKGYEYDIDLIENPKLEIKPSRRIPHAIREEVKQELDRMVKLDVIKPETEPTPAQTD